MLTGGSLVEKESEDGAYSWSECSWGEDLEFCNDVVDTEHGRECDTWCAPNSGVRDGYDCHYENIDNHMP